MFLEGSNFDAFVEIFFDIFYAIFCLNMFLLLFKYIFCLNLSSFFSIYHISAFTYFLVFPVITCPQLRKIDNVNINPLKCLSEPTNFNDACTSSCKPGFKYVSGDQTRVCLHDGTWSGKELLCLGASFLFISFFKF